MRFSLLFTFVLFMLFFAASAYAVFWVAPTIAQERTAQALNNIGVQTSQLEKPAVRYGVVRFENIALDEEGFSSIKRLDIRYSPFKLLTLKKVDSAEIYGLHMTGNMSKNATLTLAGWQNKNIILSPATFALRKLDIKDAKIDILSPALGGVSVDYDIQIIKQKDFFEFQGRASSEQKRLSFEAPFRGNITSNGIWHTQFDIAKGRLDLENYKASRVTGKLKLSGEKSRPANFLMEFTAGGFGAYETPWQNASGTIEGNANSYSTLIGAKSVGFEDIELTLNIEKDNEQPAALSGVLHANNMAQLLGYLKSQNLFPVSDEIMPPLQNTASIAAEFDLITDQTAQPSGLKYNITNIEKGIDINGEVVLLDNGAFSGNLSSAPLFLSTLDDRIFKNGKIAIVGAFKKDTNTVQGNIRTDIMDATYHASPIVIKGISGPLVMNDLSELSTENPQVFECEAPLNIEHVCTLKLSVTEGRIGFDAFNIDALGGTLEILNFAPLENDQTWTVEVRDIDLWQLTDKLQINGLSGTGTLNATLPITKRNDRLFIENGTIEGIDSGVVRYLYNVSPDFFEGDELELETIKLALENYKYNDLKIRINGPLDGETNVLIIGSGRNPELYGAREVSLHLKTKANIAWLLRNIIKTNQDVE